MTSRGLEHDQLGRQLLKSYDDKLSTRNIVLA